MSAILAFAILLGNAAAFSAEEEAWKVKPIQKVVGLLKDMSAQIAKEAEEDEEIYDNMGCWCDTNTKAKTKAITENTGKAKDLQANIEEYLAKSAQLQVDVKAIAKANAENEDALADAAAIRAKELAEFNTDEKNAIVQITGLKNAVIALSKANGASLSQTSLLELKSTLKQHLGRNSERALAELGVHYPQRKSFNSFLQTETPASGEIFGILKQMKESFEENLKKSKEDEAKAVEEYNSLKKAKTEELTAGETALANKKQELADTDEKLATSRTDLEDTEDALDADTKFMADLKEKCTNMDAAYAARQKVRTEEQEAVSEALGIITSDDAKDLMFFQKLSVSTRRLTKRSDEALRAKVVKALKAVNGPHVSVLAIMAKTDVMAKVKEAIDNMVVELKKQQKDEVKKKDFCVEELYQNERQTTQKYDLKADLETKIADLGSLIQELTDGIDAAASEVAANQIALKQAAEDRQKQNKEFQMTVTDQQATQAILQKALDRLKAFYIKKGTGLVEISASNKQAPPPGLSKGYKKSGSSNSVMQMIGTIISESKTVEKDAHEDEQAAQTAYEQFVKDTNDANTKLNKEITDKTGQKAKAEEDLTAAKADLMANHQALEKLSEIAGNLHVQCDFTLKNFDHRQAARIQEMDALNQAKAILSGASF
eukprot:gnl/MRDRNA2_/MRDRNA2_94826_c0_seq1.p1 gnl/MRDRNA2_/MRDRNA2_94826_c0~~gnl/MRDRNA2_/MRDRNA2_94826_c0_seq1.p1  ORF type:complete len:660 (-),score=243.94 gnl/MRDRNA2_/MRDRNA2_94826_c0_seq1:85-2064(-)